MYYMLMITIVITVVKILVKVFCKLNRITLDI